MSANAPQPTGPHSYIIELLADTFGGSGLDQCHCHGPLCEGPTLGSGNALTRRRARRRRHPARVAMERLRRLASRIRLTGRATRQLLLPGYGRVGSALLAVFAGTPRERYAIGRSGNRVVATRKVGRSGPPVGKDRK